MDRSQRAALSRHAREQLLPQWRKAWQPALDTWSRFTKLREPLWLTTPAEEKEAGLSDSFAMIRLDDHGILISLRQVAELKLDRFAVEVLAHEIGHHVLAPADLNDLARMVARLRASLPGLEQHAPFVGNLYTDLLINDRLTRSRALDLPGLYRALKVDNKSRLWQLYMLIYERLWSLPAGDLATGEVDGEMQVDAGLGARLVRAYRREWLDGAGRFAALVYPYLAEDIKQHGKGGHPMLDALGAGEGSVLPEGMVEREEGEMAEPLHPRDDPTLSGVEPRPEKPKKKGSQQAKEGGREATGGEKNRYRGPSDYVELMKSIGVKVTEKALINRYYRELARPHLIPFPSREMPQATDPLPEGLEGWDPGEPVSAVDWLETVSRSPQVIPGITTVQRSYGEESGGEPQRLPLDLYLGVDCSGSMVNPARALSYPILAGAVVALSALRAGAKAMACLSGEPGEYDQTQGFVRSEKEILTLLTGYLGTGYAFGIGRLDETFLKGGKPRRPTHILVITDSDLFSMLDQYPKGRGWSVAEEAVALAGGGATAVLNVPYHYGPPEKRALQRLQGIGWNTHLVSTEAEMITFARTFARATWGKGEGEREKGRR